MNWPAFGLLTDVLPPAAASSTVLTTMPRPPSSLLRRAVHRRPFHGVAKDVNPPVQITTLPNKIRVATESTPGHFSAVGLYVDAGSRYENPLTSGVSHFLDRMAFKVCISTSSLPLHSSTSFIITHRPQTRGPTKIWH